MAFETITEPANRPEKFLSDLAAQAGDVNLDRVVSGFLGAAVKQIAQFTGRHDLPCAHQEDPQHAKLVAGQV